MKTIHKTPVPITDSQHVGVAIAGTGHDARHCEGLRFLGTVQLADGALVFHVFVED